MTSAIQRVPHPHQQPTHEPPRRRPAEPPAASAGVIYDSESYAMLNRPIETERHARRVMRYLRPRDDDRLLEVGCGRGWLTQRMQERIPATYGVDVNPRSIVHAVTANLHVMDAVALEFDDEQFDHAYSFHAIEHIVDAAAALREMHRVLRPAGRILLVYPAEPIRGLYAMHRFTHARIARVAAECGLTHVKSALDLFITPQFITVLEKSPRVA
jgi:ubiquinone/menaquinone biosynthesis C-methylase UbiE